MAPVFNVMDWSAMMVPSNTEVVPSTADVPTCQKMFRDLAPPIRMTCRPADVSKVEAIWKIQTELLLP
jgi:hypothetical protein